MITVNKKNILWFVILFLTNIAFATVPANVDHANLTLGQSLTLTIDMSNTSDDPNLDTLRNNFEVYGSSTSSQTSIVNGHISSQKSMIVTLVPKNPGQQTIPAIPVGNDKTLPIQINVSKSTNTDLETRNGKVFVSASVINDASYVGVPIVYSVKLYYAVGLANVSMASLDIKNAKVEPLGKDIRYTETVKGINYQVIEQKFQITPTSAGTISVPPVKMSGSIMDNDADNFFPMTRPRPFSVSSKGVDLSVRPIPAGISKDEWFPAKQVSIKENWPNSSTLKLGQPITRTILVTALGVPASSIPDLTFKTPTDVNVYPDKTISDNQFSGDDLAGSKTFKLAYIPTTAGTVQFPETSIKWWDTKSNTLKTTIIPAKTFTILNENGKVIDASGITPQAITTDNTRKEATGQIVSSVPQNNTWFYIALLTSILWLTTLVGAIIFFLRKKPKITSKTRIINPLNDEKKAYMLVQKACQEQDIAALNASLVAWAAIYWQKKVYTVSDIKDMTSNDKLGKLIDQFNLALYKGNEFNDFIALEKEIDMIRLVHNVNHNDGLKELYPK